MSQQRTTATVTTDAYGLLINTSTLTINGVTTPVPTSTDNAGRIAAARVGKALADAGYRPATPSLYDSITKRDGYLTIDVVPA